MHISINIRRTVRNILVIYRTNRGKNHQMYVRIMGTLPYGILFLAAASAASTAFTIDIIVILAAHIHKKIRWSKHPGKTSLSPNIIISSGSFWPLVRLLSSVRYNYKGE